MRTVSDIQQEIRILEAEISEIRAKCTHSNFFVGMYMWRIASFHPARICEACGQTLPVTAEESKKCWDDWHKDHPMPKIQTSHEFKLE